MDASEALSLSAAWINYAWAREVPLASLVRVAVESTPESPVGITVEERAEPKAFLVVTHPVLSSNGQAVSWAGHSRVAGTALESMLSCLTIRDNIGGATSTEMGEIVTSAKVLDLVYMKAISHASSSA